MTEKCGNCGHVKSRHQPDCFVQFWKLGKVCDCKEFKPNHSPPTRKGAPLDTPEDKDRNIPHPSGTSTLSDNIINNLAGGIFKEGLISTKDVKEFIRELKKIIHCGNLVCDIAFKENIDKLAGKDLT